MALQAALGEWVEIQRWSLFTLTCALVQLEGGPDAALEPQEKVLLLHVIARNHAKHDGNPAMVFRLGHAVITDKSSNESIRENWAEVQKNVDIVNCNSEFAFLTSSRTRSWMAAPIGMLPVVYVIHGVGAVRYHAFTLYSLRIRHVKSQDLTDERTRAVLADLVRIMKEVLCNIVMYHRPEDPCQREPDWWICEPVWR